MKLYEEVGGLSALEKVHRIFYDKVYAHPWLGKFFAGHDQRAIEDRQTSFMGEKMGGPAYLGKDIGMVHEAMYIDHELFLLRKALLSDALVEAEIPEELRERWLKIDSAFMKKVVKEDLDAFLATRWPHKKHIVIERP